jgi:hypothetical protein
MAKRVLFIFIVVIKVNYNCKSESDKIISKSINKKYNKMENIEKNKLLTILSSCPNREGEIPKTIGPAPHTQTNQFPSSDDFADQLHQYIMTFDGVINGESHIGDGGLRAYFNENNKNRGFTKNFLIDNEFAHIHRHGSKSLHIVLPPDIGQEMDKKGWTENHPLSVAKHIPETNFMLFGARTIEELKISKVLLRISFLYSTNQW